MPLSSQKVAGLASAHRPFAPQRRDMFHKTKMCKFYQVGRCTRGYECIYAHSVEEMQKLPDLHKTELCTQFTFRGFCDHGDSCRFAHGSRDLQRASETKGHPHKTQSAPCASHDDSSRDGGNVIHQAMHPCLGVSMMDSSRFHVQHLQTRHAPVESACKSLDLRLEQVHVQRQQHYEVGVKMRCEDSEHGQKRRTSNESSSYTGDFTEQNVEAMEESCKERCEGEDDVGLLPKLEEADAVCDQTCHVETDVQLFCDDDINDKPELKRSEELRRSCSRKSTAESSTTSSSLFVHNPFCLQTSECSATDPESLEEVLCVKNTFLEWTSPLCTASIRSKSSQGRIGSCM